MENNNITIEELQKEIKDLNEKNSSLKSMYEMTTLYLKQTQEDLKKSEQEARQANRNLTDSISYAKHIQNAFTIDQNNLKKYLAEPLVFLKPKDIVSGDFVWAYEHNEYVYLAIGDCTGHGVPGAMLTIFIISTLNQISATITNEQPSHILETLDNSIQKYLGLYTQKVKDSAEIALLKYNRNSKELKFSGAKRPLLIIRSEELQHYKGARYVLGNPKRRSQELEDITIQLQAKDMVYSFSDGFPDQFGDEQGIKYSTKKLLNFLQNIAILPTEQQRENLETELISWQNKFPQIDDILVAGFKVL